MKKKILVLFFILFIFLTSSCKSQEFVVADYISFSISIASDGKITQSISFPTQEEDMNLSKSDLEKYINELIIEIKSKLFFPYFVNFYTTSVLNGVQEYNIGGKKMNYELPKHENKAISFSFTFADSETWEYYHPSDDEEKGLNIEKGFFVNLGKSESEFIFSQKAMLDGKEQTLGKYFISILNSVQSKFVDIKNLRNPDLAYTYAHFSTKLHTNADEKFEKNGQNFNVWHTSVENLTQEKPVEIYVYSPNRAIWYTLAICLTLVIMLFATLFHKLSQKHLVFSQK